MKVIGITRRMDDLGRVVIPKEVRQSLGINEGDFLEIVGTDRGLLMQKCGEAYGNEPVPKGVETEEKDKIFVFRDQDCMVHLVSLSKKAEELCRWLEELGLLDEDMWWGFVATMQREIFKRFAPFGAFLFVFFRGRTAQDGRGPIFSGSAVSTKYVRKCCAI